MGRAYIRFVGFLAIMAGLMVGTGCAQNASAPATTSIPATPAMKHNQAESPPVKAVQFGDWSYRCVKVDAGAGKTTEQCEVAQTIQVKEQGKDLQLLTMAFARTALPADPKTKKMPGEGLLFTALVPLNMFLPSGLLFMDGEREVLQISYRNCNQAGCWAQSLVDDKFVKGLTAAKTPIARMQLVTGQKINLKYSVNGLDKALSALGILFAPVKPVTTAPAVAPKKK